MSTEVFRNDGERVSASLGQKSTAGDKAAINVKDLLSP